MYEHTVYLSDMVDGYPVRETVIASRVFVENGDLIFYRADDSGYDRFVAAYARGTWIKVERREAVA